VKKPQPVVVRPIHEPAKHSGRSPLDPIEPEELACESRETLPLDAQGRSALERAFDDGEFRESVSDRAMKGHVCQKDHVGPPICGVIEQL
jgi:hypothetical protein